MLQCFPGQHLKFQNVASMQWAQSSGSGKTQTSQSDALILQTLLIDLAVYPVVPFCTSPKAGQHCVKFIIVVPKSGENMTVAKIFFAQ